MDTIDSSAVSQTASTGIRMKPFLKAISLFTEQRTNRPGLLFNRLLQNSSRIVFLHWETFNINGYQL